MNRVTDSSYDDRCESFTYDKVGNRLTKTTNDITEKYVYNVKNQLKELHKDSRINYFTYDKQGNTIKEETATGNNIFEYNTLNQQVKAITKEGNTLVSRYDTEGLRAEIEENEKLTKFIFHKENILVEADKDFNAISRLVRGYEVVAADIADLGEDSNLEAEPKLNRYYYTVDEQGSTTFITDKNQSIRNEYHYDAFGSVLDSKEDVHNRITYTGQQFDRITGQYYLRARFYNPVIGRFTQEDVYRGDGLNLYAYCGNNPVGYYDPSGYSSFKKESAFEATKGGSNLQKKLITGEEWNSYFKEAYGAENVSLKGTDPADFLNSALSRQGLNTAPAKLKETWIQGGYKYEVRIHPAEAEYGKTNSIYRVSRQNVEIPTGVEYMGTDGNWYHTSVLKPGRNGNINANFNNEAAEMTHIQLP